MLHLRPSYSLALLAALPLFVACGYGDHMHDGNGYGSGNGYCSSTSGSAATVEQATIDVDRTLDMMEPGGGAAVFVEYQAGGTYHITTGCKIVQGTDCYWDLLVTPLDGAPVQGVAPVELESDDSVSIGAGNQARLVAYTGRDFDGFTLQTEPGAAIEIDALLDNCAANSYLFWVGDGALQKGAPSNPVDLIPSDK